jgi:hypothetical protein
MALVDELRRARFRGAGRMAFLAHREAIAQALAAGASKKAVWQLLQAKGQMPIWLRTLRRVYAPLCRGAC